MTTATLAPVRTENFAKEFIHELRVKPNDNLRVFLGRFDFSDRLKGFIIEVTPSTVPQEAVQAVVTRLESPSGAKFFLDISNKGARSVRARVRKI